MKYSLFSLISVAFIFMGCQHTIFGSTSWQYEVSGTAQTVNITKRDAQGNIIQHSNVELPWSYSFSRYNTHTFLASITAQNNYNNGSVTVRIIRNGREVRSATSEGAFVIASASYHMTSTF